jgi:hypothetical protein
MNQRKIKKVEMSPAHPGFLGEGHTASAVIDGRNFSETDPFILLMDDRLNLPGGPPVGGPHPHAGFETVTLVLQGNEKDWKTGSLELMTAGKGIIHTEEITAKTNMRILQLWLVLPPEKRWAEPRLQQLLLENVPVHKTDNSETRVYSGSSNGLTSPLQNHTPFTLVDFTLKPNGEITQALPATYHAFVYVIEGTVQVGETTVTQGQAAWFDNTENRGESEINFKATDQGTRFVLYGGEPHHVPVVSHGPFIGDRQDDITRLYHEYRHGKLPHLNDLPAEQKIHHSLHPAS